METQGVQSKQYNCILLVDDDGTTNFINHKVITELHLSYNIQTEINGERALNFLHYYAENHRNQGPELIILDLKMPVLDGFEFLEYFKMKKFDNKDQIKIIVLTTSMHEDDLKKLRSQNIEYITKPLTAGKLLSIL